MTARADGLRAGLINVMQVLGQTSLKRYTYTASIGKARKSVEVSDVELLPAGCFKTTKAPDKLAIKALLETNTPVSGAALVTDSPSLTIRSQ